MGKLLHGEKRPCEACGTEILGVLGIGDPARVQPLVVGESAMAGNVLVTLQGDGWRAAVIGDADVVAYLRERGVRLWVNHFADCAEAARFRR